MNVHFSYKADKTRDIESELDQQAQRIGRFLQAYRPDLVHLHATMDFGQRQGFTCTLNLRLPSGQLSSSNSDGSGVTAIKASFSELTRELKKHKDILRSRHKWRHAARKRGPDVAGSNVLDRVAARAIADQPIERDVPRERGPLAQPVMSAETFENGNGLASAIKEFVDTSLEKLERFVTRELRIRQASGDVAPDSLTTNEVIDEAVVRALTAEEKPANVTVDRWLRRLAVEVIKAAASSNSSQSDEVHLEASVGIQNVSGSDDEVLQFHQPEETQRREDVIANQQQANPEEMAANDESLDQIIETLKEAKSEDREAFMLLTIQGFTVDEIAQVADRESTDVRKSIANAREIVQKKLPPSNELKKHLLEHSRVA